MRTLGARPFGVVCVALVLALWGAASPSTAKVFVSQNDALKEAFPDATRIDRKTHILRAGEVEKIEAIAGGRLESKLVALHTAYREDDILGFAHIDVHTVRTQAEAFLVSLEPSGVVRSVRVLAFHEPLDYLPTDRWYAQFQGKTSGDALRVGRDVHGVVGATLSARAASEGVRRMIAYWRVLLQPTLPSASPSSVSSTPFAPKSGSDVEAVDSPIDLGR